MNACIEDLRPTIVPKSDQLNAEQLLGGSMTITVSDVRVSDSGEQPVIVHYAGENGRPFKPCKTMRKVLIHAWGPDGRAWIGRSMTVYNDPAVKFGGEDVGGIRISHMSDIERDVKVSLTSTRGKKAKYEIKRMTSRIASQLHDIRTAPDLAALKDTFGAAYKATKEAGDRAQLKAAYDARTAELQQPAPTFDPAAYIARIQACTDLATLQLMSDEAEDLPHGEAREAVMAALLQRDGELAAGGVKA